MTNMIHDSLEKRVLPGSNGGILTLANGKQIVLDSAGNGTLAIQGNSKVLCINGKILYADRNKGSDALLYNTMTTPRGRQYQMVLSDGSKVWMNAASSIRFPVKFSKQERKVEITGEAYFEVVKNTASPFSIVANSQAGRKVMEVQAIGTHLNISSYDDEAMIRTTLLEGAVKIAWNNTICLLQPGQQAVINNSTSGEDGIKIRKDVNVDAVTVWKNGYFSFGQTGFNTLMQQIARWYDVDIIYAGKIPNLKFGGEVSRNTPLSQILKILEESNVHFTVEGRNFFVDQG